MKDALSPDVALFARNLHPCDCFRWNGPKNLVHRNPWGALIQDDLVKSLAERWGEDNLYKAEWIAYWVSPAGFGSMDQIQLDHVRTNKVSAEYLLSRIQNWYDEAVAEAIVKDPRKPALGPSDLQKGARAIRSVIVLKQTFRNPDGSEVTTENEWESSNVSLSSHRQVTPIEKGDGTIERLEPSNWSSLNIHALVPDSPRSAP